MAKKTSAKPPPRPEPHPPVATHPLFAMWDGVRSALTALPAHFRSETSISGLRATDIFTLSATLGAAIEDQVVATLNSMRPVWDPDGDYPLFRFVRQAQTFPDVLLTSRVPDKTKDSEIAFGIELKGWYLLAKEGEPSFRYQVTSAACSHLDLIVVVPWFLSSVISGVPKVLQPYIELARYAAEFRNYHWQQLRVAKSDTRIESPTGVKPYPIKSEQILDRPKQDAGGNFGRFARTGLMDQYMATVNDEPIAGIEARYWRQFFKMFQEHDDPAHIASVLKRLQDQLKTGRGKGEESSFGLQLLEAIRTEFDLE